MSMSDPIADFLTRIRNGHMANKFSVDVPSSKLKIRILYVLREEKFIRDYFMIKDNKQNVLRIFLKYDDESRPVIQGLKKISTPGCRRYVPSDKIPRVLNGMGISIISTPKGVMSNKKAQLFNLGGEVLCQVW